MRKYTYEEVKNYIENKSESGCKLLSTEYMGIHEMLKVQCKCGNEFEASFNSFRQGSPKCEKCGKTKWNYEKVKYYIEVESNSGCKLLSTEHINIKSKLEIKCKCGDKFKTSLHDFKNMNQRQCGKCSNKISWNYELVKHFIEVESNSGCKLLSNTYMGSTKKLKLQCKCGDIFEVRFSDFKARKPQLRQCPKCNNKIIWDYDSVKSFIEIESNSGCKLISVNYKSNKDKLKIKCSCGEYFDVKFNAFFNGNQRQCQKCGVEIRAKKRRIPKEEAINILNRYGYEVLGEYINSSKKIIIRDSVNYLYYVSLREVCDTNGNLNIVGLNNPYSIQNIKNWCKINQKAFELLSDTYKGDKKKLQWKCLNDNCGEIFENAWNSIRAGQGCGYCVGKRVGQRNSFQYLHPDISMEWSSKNINIYPSDVTANSHKKIIWKCAICGNEWIATVQSRHYGSGCPVCAESKGEKEIKRILKLYNIPCDSQYVFDDLIGLGGGLLRFDVSIFKDEEKTKLRCLIEYDGQQHYKWVKWMMSKRQFIILQKHDKLKNEYCKKNNIYLIRIPFWEFDNIESIIREALLEKSDSAFLVKETTERRLIS
jgi:hypothetical protein